MHATLASVLVVLVYAFGETMWLLLMNGYYTRHFSKFTLDHMLALRSPLAMYMVYPLLLAGFFVLVLWPLKTQVDAHRDALDFDETYMLTLAKGMMFGLVVYGVYNLTNVATLPGYPWNLVAVDTLWGVFWFGILALVFRLSLSPAGRSARAAA